MYKRQDLVKRLHEQNIFHENDVLELYETKNFMLVFG